MIRHRYSWSRWQRYRGAVVLSPLLLTTVMTGCAKDTVRHAEQSRPAAVPPGTSAPRYPSLAGTWEYEEHGKTVLIRLNEDGNGTYEWKDGRFITTTYAHGIWRGVWLQPENDRDGGFEIVLAQGGSEGEGRWWYTRIGTDAAPAQGGGLFQITRRIQSSHN